MLLTKAQYFLAVLRVTLEQAAQIESRRALNEGETDNG